VELSCESHLEEPLFVHLIFIYCGYVSMGIRSCEKGRGVTYVWRDSGIEERIARSCVANPISKSLDLSIFLYTAFFFFFFFSFPTTQTPQTESAQSEKHCRRRSASSGQKTRRSIEGEKPGCRRYREVLLPERSLIEEKSSERPSPKSRQSVPLFWGGGVRSCEREY